MLETLRAFFASPGFEPHGHCFLWEKPLLWLYVASDSLIALSYYAIPVALTIFVRKRKDLAFNWMFVMFGAFMVAYGTTHVMAVWTLWQPVYWLDGGVKAVTAALSFATAVILWPLIPKALSISGGELRRKAFEREIAVARLKQSEERFRLLVEGVKDYAIYLLDPRGFVTTWNAGAERINGYRTGEIIGKHFSCFYPPEDIQSGKPSRALRMAASEGKYEEENLRVRKDGSQFWASVLITALHDGAGKVYGYAKVVRDITERREIQRKLQEKERLATLGTTAAVFAHEIGNFLNGFSTSIELVDSLLKQSGNPTPVVQEAIQGATREVERLSSLLKGYRSFARPQQLNLETADLRQIVEEVIASLWRAYGDSGVQFNLDFRKDCPLVSVDKEKMKQVMLNLFKNAFEAMPDGGVITCKGYPSNNDGVMLEVSDTGTGIAEGVNVFQLFRTTKPEGTGLGLPIVEQIVRDHRGAINYVNEIGKGTTFTIWLPLAPRAA